MRGFLLPAITSAHTTPPNPRWHQISLPNPRTNLRQKGGHFFTCWRSELLVDLVPVGSFSGFDIIPSQQRLDVWSGRKRWNDVAEDVHLGAEVLEDLFQVFVLFVCAL